MKTKLALLCVLLILGAGFRALAQGDTLIVSDATTGLRPVHLYMPHVKPVDVPLSSLGASFRNDTRLAGDALGVFSPDKESAVAFTVFGHADGFLTQLDLNGDGYMDEPKHLGVTLGSNWQVDLPAGATILFGVRGMLDNRLGGQLGADDVLPVIFARDKVRGYAKDGAWQACLVNRSGDGFVEVNVPFERYELNVSADYSYQWMNSTFGNENLLPQLVNIYYGHHATAGPDPTCRIYDTGWSSALAKATFGRQDGTGLRFGVLDRLDDIDEAYCDTYSSIRSMLNDLGAFADWSYSSGALDLTAGARADWFNRGGFKWAPVFKAAWTPGAISVHAEAGRDYRYTFTLLEHMGALATGKTIDGIDILSHPVEDAWSYGAGAKLNLGGSGSNYLTLDLHRRSYIEQVYLDYDRTPGRIAFVLLSEMESGRSFVNDVKLGLHSEPVRGMRLDLLGTYTDARQTFEGRGLLEKPLVPRWSGRLDLNYAPGKGKWVFEVGTDVKGPCRVWDFMNGKGIYDGGRTPVYALLSARITKKFKGYEFFIAGDNLTGYTQPEFLINGKHPFSRDFDASCLWAPVTGRKVYAGFKMNMKFM